ncbi:acyl-CoA N-acyltransferase [Gilbertella persicaria]|uniref:N-acetyltransferase domain-containing protein n=1 Tax=Rhizopus stolonifer TaxID=4846 RepID=A0A367J5R7_RHIST|nr:acyl-CoA N-acyltransferase [Gilbertella persicaria]KAI8053126.1 acyl-CoA N-acyltransferase [Gilbertella persicaria]RCH85270.1 hypothetical protein CU098_000003 [Rhizopus stolonifer]
MTINTYKYDNVSIVQVKDFERPHAVRHKVFVLEQGYSSTIETDDLDDKSTHWVATCDKVDQNGTLIESNVDVGTIRLVPKNQNMAKLTRFAVVQNARGLKIGQRLLEAFIDYSKKNGFDTIVLHSQHPKRGFYEKAGFVVERGDDEVFIEAGTPHVRMWMRNLQDKS